MREVALESQLAYLRMIAASLTVIVAGCDAAPVKDAGTDAGVDGGSSGLHSLRCDPRGVFCGAPYTLDGGPVDAGPIPRNMTINAQCDLVADGFSITLQRNGDLTQGTMVIGTICDLQGDTATIDTAWGTRQICRSFTNLVWNPNNGTGDPDAGAALAQACSE